MECHPCRTKNRPARLGTGKQGIGKHKNALGYIVLSKTDELEHRAVMAAFIGRALGHSEHVHHKNGNRSDNRIENLELLDCREHHRKHMTPDRAKQMSVLGHAARWGGQNSNV